MYLGFRVLLFALTCLLLPAVLDYINVVACIYASKQSLWSLLGVL